MPACLLFLFGTTYVAYQIVSYGIITTFARISLV